MLCKIDSNIFMVYIHGMMPKHDAEEQSTSGATTSHKRYLESRFYALRGVFMLLLGSGLLLACKLPLPGLMMQLCVLLGGGAILLGNGYILFGLLVYADSRHSN